jgi:hypothetical protein
VVVVVRVVEAAVVVVARVVVVVVARVVEADDEGVVDDDGRVVDVVVVMVELDPPVELGGRDVVVDDVDVLVDVVVVVVEVDVVVAPTVGGIVVGVVVPIVVPDAPPGDVVPTGPRLVVDALVDDVDAVARSVGGGVTTKPATVTDGSGMRLVVVVERSPDAFEEGTAARSPTPPSSRNATATVPPASTRAAIGSAAFAQAGHRSYICIHRADAGVGACTGTTGGYSKLRGTPSGPIVQPWGNCSGGNQVSPERHQPGPGAPSPVMLRPFRIDARVERRCRGSSNREYRDPHPRNWATRPIATVESAGVASAGVAEEVATHIAGHVTGHGLRFEPPDTVDQAEAIFVAVRPDRLQWEVVDLLQHDDVRATHGAPGVLVDLDDRVRDHVTRVRRTVVGVAARVALVHLAHGVGADVSLPVARVDPTIGEQQTDAFEVATVDQLGVAIHEVEHRGVVLAERHAALTAGRIRAKFS